MADLDKVYFSPVGRIKRLPYFLYAIALLLIMVVFEIGIMMFGSVYTLQPGIINMVPTVIWIIEITLYILIVYSMVILSIKRLHDRNHSGWWLAIGLIPILTPFMLIYLLFFPGTSGANRFGNPSL